jgi:carbonic anhydrase
MVSGKPDPIRVAHLPFHARSPVYFSCVALKITKIAAMQQLLEGVHRFREDEFGRYKAMFRRLSRHGQKPHTLFITCADSRVLAELITQSNPGDLFVIKNVGNLVPSSDISVGFNSTGAGIEFAVEMLGVSDVVVCGHSDCGAIAALMSRQSDWTLKHLHSWVELAAPVRELIETKYQHLTNPEERARAAEEENVLFSIEQLHTYACVARRLAEGSLRLHAWFFKISTGELFAYDPEKKQFMPITREANPS